MRRFAFLLFAACTAALPMHGEDVAIPLVGSVQGDTYISPTGAFRITIPVAYELGGSITDTANVVTFQDPFSSFITIVAFPQDTTEKWELETRGRKDYLVNFFQQHVIPDFQHSFKNVQIPSTAHFLPSMLDGALLTYMLLPGGSMFNDPEHQIADPASPPVAKRGNLIFVHNGFIFVISTELAERVTEGSAYHQTSAAEDDLLKDRLVDIVSRMRFTPRPAAAASSPGN